MQELTNLQSPALTAKVLLNDGRSIPQIGLGTWKMTDQAVLDNAIDAAMEIGYKHFDTAELYENEEMVGKAIKKACEKYGVKREDIWITTKIPPHKMGYENAKESIEDSLKALDCGYLDLILIHWPTSISSEAGEVGRADTYRAIEEVQATGLVKSIGISNFMPRHVEQLLKVCKVIPAVNQIETHPLYQEEETIKICQANGITLIAYAPLATCDEKLTKNETIVKLCEKYGKQPSQITLRWAVDRGFVAIPKSSQKSHIVSNISIGDFKLEEEEVKLIDQLNIMYKTDWDPKDEP